MIGREARFTLKSNEKHKHLRLETDGPNRTNVKHRGTGGERGEGTG